MKSLLSAILLVLLIGCATPEPTFYARVSATNAYPKDRKPTVILLPVILEGKGSQTSDNSITDSYAQKFMENGYRIIDYSQVESHLSDNGMSLDVSKMRNAQKAAQGLRADGILQPTVAYQYAGGSSVTVGSQNSRAANIYGESQEGNYYLSTVSLKMTNANTGELMLTAYCPAHPSYSAINEILYAINYQVYGYR